MDKAGIDRIVQNVFLNTAKLSRRSDHMIIALVLPERLPALLQQLIRLAGTVSFEAPKEGGCVRTRRDE